ncbi:MAG: hypothetical protein C4523_19625 [Myxococcales bacterium]|nr:MAG: hypothetical protein C4523_19625 [Myxococcales bacterium]
MVALPNNDEVILDGWRFKLLDPAPGLSVLNLATFDQKVIFGDYTRDSHRLLSQWVLSDLSGGHGISERREGTDNNRYRFGTLYTRHPHQISLPRRASGGGEVEISYPLGDLIVSGTVEFFSARDTEIYQFNGSTMVNTTHTLASPPVNKSVAFKGTGTYRLYIPLGANGYATYDNSGNAVVTASPTVQAFCVWDNKLIALSTTGQLYSSLDGSTFTSYGDEGKLDEAWTPRHLKVFYDRSGNPAICLITDRDVWFFDPAGPTLYRASLQFPPGPSQGLGAAVWRDELYVSVGMGVHRFNGSSVSAIGLDRDDGLPIEQRGYIVDLQEEYNGLYALILGKDTGAGQRYGGVHVLTGFGWHPEWITGYAEFTAAASGDATTWLTVSAARGTYRLYWGFGGLYALDLPVEFTNPRALVADSIGNFAIEETHFLETGWFNADLRGVRKIANAVHLTMQGDMTNVTFTVKYRIDHATAWTTLGTVTATGQTHLPFGTADADGVYPGLTFESIELRLEIIKSAGVTTSPIIEHVVLSFLKVQESINSWTAVFDLREPYQGKSPAELRDKLDDLISAGTFVNLSLRGPDGNAAAYRVRVAQFAANDQTGQDPASTARVNLIEIPLALGAGA